MAMFKGFKPQGLQKIASRMGYAGRMEEFDNYLEQNPEKQREMITYQAKAQEMANGGYVSMQTGGMPNYVNPIKTGGGAGGLGTPGASVMQYGYNPTTNQYSISGGGSKIFPRGFESSMSPDELYKKYPNIKGVFERGVPMSTPGGEGGGFAPMGQIPVINPRDPIDFQKQRLEEVKDSLAPEIYDRYYAGLYGELPKIEDPKDANTTGTTRGVSLGSTTPTMPDKRPELNSLIGRLPQAPNPSGQRPMFQQGQPISQVMPTFTPPPVQDFQAKLNIPTQPTGPNMATDTNIEDFSVQQALNPTLPQGGATVAADTPVTKAQMVDPNTGQVIPKAPTVDTARVGTTTTSTAPTATPASTMDASLSNLNVTQALQPIQSAQGSVTQQAQLDAQQQTASKVSELKAAQGTATLMQNPVQRQVQAGELISGGVANAQTASTYAEQIQAAEATPSAQATVQGQLANLTANFDASNPPAWAAGALRGVQAQMAARGLGTSSIAAQAMVQGALESALPIAQADANTIASFEQANLSNRQQRAMLSAQQRATFIGQEFDQAFQTRVQNAAKIGDIANMNFTAEQNIALENSKAVNTMGLANLSNNQAMVIAEASALANLDMSNLNNRQQAAVQNAQSFMQMDMANLNNNQQTDMFKAQSLVQSLFNDQSATNASNQFNATSQNQTDQFFANLAATVANFNAEQSNAMSRYNSGELNALEQFNSTMKNQREQFNAQNRLVIDQSNAQWRRQVATSDTATINRVNELNARALIDLSTGAYNNLWQGFRDDMEFSWKTNDNALERAKDITLRRMQDESTVAAAALAGDQQMVENLTNGLLSMATTDTGNTMVGKGLDFISGIDYGNIWDTGSDWLSKLDIF